MGKKENAVETYLTERVEAHGGECLKWESPGRIGVPDRIVLLPFEAARFVETKAKDGVLESWQERCHERLRELGYSVDVLWTLEQVDHFIEGATCGL